MPVITRSLSTISNVGRKGRRGREAATRWAIKDEGAVGGDGRRLPEGLLGEEDCTGRRGESQSIGKGGRLISGEGKLAGRKGDVEE